MVSEDSDEVVSGLAVVHRLCYLRDLDEPLSGHMSTGVDDLHAPRELLEIALFGRPQWILTEERDDPLHEVCSTTNVVLAEMLLVVVVSLVDVDLTHPEEPPKLFEALTATLALRYDKPVKHLIAGSVASSPRTV